jgi:hypothetical protein
MESLPASLFGSLFHPEDGVSTLLQIPISFYQAARRYFSDILRNILHSYSQKNFRAWRSDIINKTKNKNKTNSMV